MEDSAPQRYNEHGKEESADMDPAKYFWVNIVNLKQDEFWGPVHSQQMIYCTLELKYLSQFKKKDE